MLTSIIKPGMRGVFYGRHSTDKQTMDTQRNMCIEFINRVGCICVGEYLDAGISARKKTMQERPGISQLMADATFEKV